MSKLFENILKITLFIILFPIILVIGVAFNEK